MEDERGPERAIPTARRACARDDECVTVHADCSNVRCVGVHRDHASDYAAPLDCSDYRGPVANYDCLREFGSERPACQDSLCVSVPLARE
ncbi:MAG: hypothetical protein H6713_38600 [Myxococcales bacterium]|nr:hypothetical protein [Myxococcales bacterium]